MYKIHDFLQRPYISNAHQAAVEPRWSEIEGRLKQCPQTIDGFERHELERVVAITKEHWMKIASNRQFIDPVNGVVHLGAVDAKSRLGLDLPRCIEIHEGKLYVLGKGRECQRLGKGSHQRVARVVCLNDLSRFAHVTLAASGFDNQSELIDCARRQYSAYQITAGSECVISLFFATVYTRPCTIKFGFMIERAEMDLYELMSDAKKDSPHSDIARRLKTNFDDFLSVFHQVRRIPNALKKLGLVHHDLKLDNLLLVLNEKGNIVVKVCDLEQTRTPKQAIADFEDNVAPPGTVIYMGPEANSVRIDGMASFKYFDGGEPMGLEKATLCASHATDVWSIGIILGSLLINGSLIIDEEWLSKPLLKEKFVYTRLDRWTQGDNLRSPLKEHAAEVAQLIALVKKALVYDPDKRISPEDLAL